MYMDISLQSLLFFIIITLIYFSFSAIGKPVMLLADLASDEAKTNYYYKNLKSLAFYLGVVVFSQFFLNIVFLISKCGGAVDKNVGAAALFTFVPWVLLFGTMIATLLIFPGFKSPFSDTIGYYSVAGKANELLSSMLTSGTTEDKPTNEPLTKTAELIAKILGNKSILINQMNPENFLNIWDTLKPLMVPNAYENMELKQELLNLVTFKDRVGEGFWYLYTAILISSIVYYNLAVRGCVKSIDQIAQQREDYIKQQEELNQQNELNKSTVYTR